VRKEELGRQGEEREALGGRWSERGGLTIGARGLRDGLGALTMRGSGAVEIPGRRKTCSTDSWSRRGRVRCDLFSAKGAVILANRMG
jgi:hypothetical protein